MWIVMTISARLRKNYLYYERYQKHGIGIAGSVCIAYS